MSEAALFRLPERPLRLAFFGTPDIAATVLSALIEAGQDELCMVISQPDRPKGRGKKLSPTPVHAVAEAHGLPLLQPSKLRDGALAAELRAQAIDLAVVIAYGRILPVGLFTAPRFDSVNLHTSLLPRHRGAAPIQHAILAGDQETGVSLMQISEGMDEGDVLLQSRLRLSGVETGGSLFEALATLSAELIVEGLTRAKREGLQIRPQDPALATHAPMLKKADGALDLRRPAAELERQLRAFNPWPGSFIARPEGPLRVTQAAVVDSPPGPAPGTILSCERRLLLQTGAGALDVLELQPAGKKPMPAAAFLNGAGRELSAGVSIGVDGD